MLQVKEHEEGQDKGRVDEITHEYNRATKPDLASLFVAQMSSPSNQPIVQGRYDKRPEYHNEITGIHGYAFR